MNALVALGVLERSGEARPLYTSQRLNGDSRPPVRLGDCARITSHSEVIRQFPVGRPSGIYSVAARIEIASTNF
jgi:hypothetical protein